ncbi:MAG: IS3 family transposase [Oscillospiraceae bacterium]
MRQRRAYAAIREAHEETGYPIELACKLLHAARSAYHKWASGKLSQRAAENERLADTIEKIHAESPDKGYRRLNDDLRHDCGIHVNDKRVLRICRARDIRSTDEVQQPRLHQARKNPQYLAENLLDRKFYAEKPNEKWLTDVTEFKWYEGNEIHKLYLSAILDLCDRRIVSYVLSERNDNPLVFKTVDKGCAGQSGRASFVPQRQRVSVHQPYLPPQACAGWHDAEYVPRGALH